jgi:hypothetical protein
MPVALDQELYRAAARTFEDLAFLLPDPGEAADAPEANVWAAVDFRGPFCGRLAVGCSQDMLAPLAANMLGEGEAPSVGQQLDALSEVANVLCGNLLPAIGGTQAVFRMGAPQVCHESPCCGAQPAAHTHVDLHEGWAQVLLFMDQGAVARAQSA